MSRRSPSFPQAVKLPLPLSSRGNSTYSPSYQDVESKPKNVPDQVPPVKLIDLQSPKKVKDILKISPAKALLKAKSPVSTAGTNSQAFSPSPKKTAGQNTYRPGSADASKVRIPLSRMGTLSAEKSPQSRRNRVKSPTSKVPEVAPQRQEFTAEQINERLYRIFQFYTTFGERSNVGYLKNHRFMKMMVDAEIRDEFLNQSSLDLIYAGELRHSGNLNFDRYLNLLARVAKVKYEGQEEESECLDLLLKNHMFPLYERIFQDTDLSFDEEKRVQIAMEEGTKMVMNEVGDVLDNILKMYFPFDIQTGQDPQIVRQRMENAFFIFLRDFGICPGMLNKGAAYALWNEILRTQIGAPENEQNLNQNILDQSILKDKTTRSKYSTKQSGFNVLDQSPRKDQSPKRDQTTKSKFSRKGTQDGFSVLDQSPSKDRTTKSKFARGNTQEGINAMDQSPNRERTTKSKFARGNTQAGFSVLDESRDKTARSRVEDGDKHLAFNGEKFKLFLVRTANLAFQDQMKDPETPFSQPEKAAQLLERMDIAYKVLNTEKKSAAAVMNSGGKAKKMKTTSLLVSQDSLNKIMDHLKAEQAVIVPKKVANTPGKEGKKKSTVIVTTGTDYEKYDIDDDDLIRLFEKQHYPLLKVFQYYCSFGEPLNSTKLHAFKFNKLLREAGLLQANPTYIEHTFKVLQGAAAANENTSTGITGVDADIIVAALTGPKQVREINEKKLTYDPDVETPFLGYLNYLYKNHPLDLVIQGRLDFEAFLKALIMVSEKIYPKMAPIKAVTQIVERNLLGLEKEISQIQKMIGTQPLKALVDLLQDIQTVQFLGVVHKSMMLYYKFYSDSKGMMNIEKFMQFCRDFGIFPYLLPKGKLCTFFNALAGVRSQAEETEALQIVTDATKRPRAKQTRAIEQTEDDLIDQHMFIEALALCALEIPYLNPQPSETEKIINLLEKLNVSEGPTIVKKRIGNTRPVNGMSWDIMQEIRVKYPEFFKHPEEEVAGEAFKNLVEENLKRKN